MEEEKNVVTEQVDASAVNMTSAKRSPARLFFFGLSAVIGICLIVGYVVLLQQVRVLSTNSVVLSLARTLRLPAATVNGRKVLYADYTDDLATLKNFYAKNPANGTTPTHEQISDQVLSRLIANTLVDSVSDHYAITLNADEKEAAKQTLLKNFSSPEEARQKLREDYGWDMEMYLAKVVYPLFRERKLQGAYVSSTDAFGASGEEEEVHARHILFTVKNEASDPAVKARAEAVLKRAKAGEDFAALAKSYGSDDTKDTGGDLGWFGKGAMVPEFEAAAFALKPGDMSDLVKSQFGYHIIRVDETRMVRSFIKFMDGTLKDATVHLAIAAHDPFEQFRLNDGSSKSAAN